MSSPFIEIDVRSFAYYFRKNKAEDDIVDNMKMPCHMSFWILVTSVGYNLHHAILAKNYIY
jgi:hypothetical protein